MNTKIINSQKIIATILSAAVLAGAPLAAFAQTDQEKARQKEKNDMRNLGTGLGGAALFSLLKGKGTQALILGGGAAYAGKKMEDARKAQAKEQRERDERENRPYRYRNSSSNRERSMGLSGTSDMTARQPVDVIVNSQPVSFAGDAGAEVIGGHTYVPLRGVLERLGATVNYDSSARSVIATKGNKIVKLPAEGEATVNGETVNLDAPAFVMNGRTMVPLRFMAETFDAQVNYDASDRTVRINGTGDA